MIGLWSRRGRIALGAVGIVLTIAPIVGAHLIIERSTRDHARQAVSEIAADFVAQSERAILRGLDAASSLVRAGVAGCAANDLTLMRRVVTSVLPIKVVALLDGDGHLLCNQFGTGDEIVSLSPSRPLNDGEGSLELVRLRSTGDTAVMVVRGLAGGGGVATFVSSEVIASDMVPVPLRSSLVGLLTLVDGKPIANIRPTGADPLAVPHGEMVTADASSARLPIAMHLSIPYRTFELGSADLLLYARLGGGVASGLVLIFLIYLLKGTPVEIARLHEAEARHEFVPYYQPVVDIASGRLVGCEVLVRWVKPNGVVIEPDSFIRLAESSGIAMPMTRSLMRAVRADLDHAFGTRPQLKIGINLFNDHFFRLGTVHDIETIFGGGSLSFGQLTFELTERQPLRNIQRARVVIRELQALGARVALDDAGAGHGGLAYLHHLGVDVVKIDRLFIRTIGEGKTAAPIVDSLIKLGHDLGMEVVAEGVETYQQLDYLRRHGADSAQGYLFSPPLPARAFLDLVEAMEPATRELAMHPAAAPVAALVGEAAVSAA